jgi:hypothetical protein
VSTLGYHIHAVGCASFSILNIVTTSNPLCILDAYTSYSNNLLSLPMEKSLSAIYSLASRLSPKDIDVISIS